VKQLKYHVPVPKAVGVVGWGSFGHDGLVVLVLGTRKTNGHGTKQAPSLIKAPLLRELKSKHIS